MAESTGGSVEDVEEENNVEKDKSWKFTQWFRKMQNDANPDGVTEDANFITAVEFDDAGDYLATGNLVCTLRASFNLE